jgi:uncharacterized membrane-anchored protein
MTRSTVCVGLIVAIAAQFLVLTGMVVKAAIPRWVGTEIRVRTVPIDPRSMFRGNYAQLNYEFGQLPTDVLTSHEQLRPGEIVYVTLKPGDEGLYRFAGASLDRPAGGIFLRGRIVTSDPPYRVKYGIEAFFAPKEKALQLEQDLRNGGIAVLMIDGGGRVALEDVIPDAQGQDTVTPAAPEPNNAVPTVPVE